jgi:hypothetical protein
MPDEGHPMGFEVRATSMDTTGWGSAILGAGSHVESPPDKVRPSPYKMNHTGHGGGHGGHGGHSGGSSGGGHGGHDGHVHHDLAAMSPEGGHDGHGGDDGGDHSDDHSGHHGGDHGGPPSDGIGEAVRLDYGMLRAVKPTAFPAHLKRHEMNIALTGNMPRYVWSMNGKLFSDEKYLTIQQNEVVRVTLDNQSMMRHPIHLHGHFFRVLNGQGDYAPNFHTVDVAPGQQITIEFWANEPGLWFFHCHNLFHMEMGMARLFKYKGFEIPEDLKKDETDFHQHSGEQMFTDKTLFPSGEVSLYSNHAELNTRLNGGNWDIMMTVEMDKFDPKTTEGVVLFQRYLETFLAVVGGAEYEDKKLMAVLGLAYRLPMIVDMTSYVRTDGKVIVSLRKVIPVVDRLALELNPELTVGGSGDKNKDSVDFQMETELTYRATNNVKVGLFQKYSDELGNTVGAGISVLFN